MNAEAHAQCVDNDLMRGRRRTDTRYYLQNVIESGSQQCHPFARQAAPRRPERNPMDVFIDWLLDNADPDLIDTETGCERYKSFGPRPVFYQGQTPMTQQGCFKSVSSTVGATARKAEPKWKVPKLRRSYP